MPFRYVGRVALGQLTARPITTLASAALTVLMLGIAVNALIMQRTRHPAPLFASNEREPTGATKADALNPAPDAPNPAPDTPPPVAKHAHVPGKDGISQYLGGIPVQRPPATLVRTNGDALGVYIKTKLALPAKAPEADKTVLAAQRQLIKLGYAVKPTGLLGNATKQAITRFQREHTLPETGELTPRVLRRLASASAEAE